MKKLLPILLLVILFSSCRKYRIEHTGCKEDAFMEYGMFLPNIFTPNGDAQNDILRFHHDLVAVENFSIKIRNAGGIKVFESTDPNFEWDGQRGGSSGNICKLDVFKYEMCFDANNKHYQIKKTVVIDWMGDKNKKPTDACPAQFDNCAFGSQWDGTQFNPTLPANEYFLCD